MAENGRIAVALVVMSYIGLRTVLGLHCFQCDDIISSASCSTEVTCGPDESCFAERMIDENMQIKNSYGCQKRLVCEILNTPNVVLGRRDDVISWRRVRTRDRDLPICSQCCLTDGCNLQLCQDSGESLKLVEGPSNVTANVGDQVNLTCKFSGSLAPVYAWYHETHDVTDKAVTSEGGSTLVLPSVQPGDSGLYQCRVLNRHGQASAPPALVTVLEPPSFTVKPADVSARLGDRVVLRCRGQGVPTPSPDWAFLDWTGFPTLPHFLSGLSLHRNHTQLVIRHLTFDLQGTYTCRLQNSAGSVTASARVAVGPAMHHVGPYIVRGPDDVTARENDDVTLNCDVEGDPEPTVGWFFFRNGSAGTVPRSGSKADNNSLVLRSVRVEDAGEYRCVARTGDVIDSASAFLTVLADTTSSSTPTIQLTSPGLTETTSSSILASASITTPATTLFTAPAFFIGTPTLQPSSATVTANVNATVNFTCRVSGDPPPQILWFLESTDGSHRFIHQGVTSHENVTSQNGMTSYETISTLRLNSVTVGEQGKYICKCVNRAGMVDAEATLHVNAA